MWALGPLVSLLFGCGFVFLVFCFLSVFEQKVTPSFLGYSVLPWLICSAVRPLWPRPGENGNTSAVEAVGAIQMGKRDYCFVKSNNLSGTRTLQTVIRARGENGIGQVGHLYAARAACVGILQFLCEHIL